MTQENLFEEQPDLTIDPEKDYFAELVGEGRKFKDEKALARSKMESDFHIKQVERENAELREYALKLREQNNAGPKLQELLDQISNQQQKLVSSEQPIANEVKEIKPDIDPKQIESLVSNKIQEFEAQKREQNNFKMVQEKLIERFGDKYQNTFKQHMERLGLTEEFTNELARKHPTVFMKTFGLDDVSPRENFQTPPRSQMRSDNFSPNVPKRTWSYYQKLKKEQPAVYKSREIQVQMHNDAIELGNTFQDGDYNAL